MSDTTSPPLDTGSNTDPSSTNTAGTDPNASNPTDPNASDPNATNPTDPNGGATDPNAGASDPNADPNSGTSTAGVGDADPNAGLAQTAGAAGLPSAIPNASLGQQPSATVTPSSSPSPSPSSIAGSDKDNGGAVVAFDSKNAQYRKAIIIASAVSGAVGLILVVVVIFLVYRRRNRRNRNNTKFVDATVPRPLARTGSDATWIGTRIETGPKDSFNEGKLEAGSRTSDAGSIDSDATLADFGAARAKSGAFSTPTHTPRPSVEKLKIASMPMVPEDPFEAPRLSLADRPRPSLEQMIDPVPLAVAAPRPRRSGAPSIRINSKGSYASEVVVEQGFDNSIRSPGFPVVPLVTPIEPPANWRAVLDDEFIPPPPRRDSMASLSRQSSRASSRNSRELDAEVISPSKKAVFSTIAKKRRSRADSIDPFRKSAATMMARRKSRAESIASRKSRAESTGMGAPKSPGGRRKSRAASIRRAQAQAANPNPIFDPTQNMGYSAPAPQVQVPRTPIGLPQTPRTPTAARRSRVVNGLETPRTSRGPLPLPPTPRSSGIQQQPRTPGIERPRTPGMERPRTPGMERPRTPAMPAMERPRTPGVERPRTPAIERPRTPGTDRPRTPGAERPRTPGAERPRTPGGERPRTPGTQQPRTPVTARESRTSGGRTRQPRAAVPRTPTSLDDAHWDSIPLPPAPPAPVARPLPSAPLPGGRAELRLSQLSRALSEVSRDSPI